MDITLIAALSQNGVIGKDGGLPWSLPDDLQHFKKLTLGKPVVMGHATAKSIKWPLPKRTSEREVSELERPSPYPASYTCTPSTTPSRTQSMKRRRSFA